MLEELVYQFKYHFGGNWLIPLPLHRPGPQPGIQRVEVLSSKTVNGVLVQQCRNHCRNRDGVEFTVDYTREIT